MGRDKLYQSQGNQCQMLMKRLEGIKRGKWVTIGITTKVVFEKDFTEILLHCRKGVFSVVENIVSEILSHCVFYFFLKYVQEKREN